MKIKVSEAAGIALDWMVAKCEGWEWKTGISPWFGNEPWIESGIAGVSLKRRQLWEFAYSTKWAHGGPIIEREFIGVNPRVDRTLEECWSAQFYEGVKNDLYVNEYGPTPLIAAMRCYVASKLGDEVEVPEGLCK